MSAKALSLAINNMLNEYFRDLDGEAPAALYDMVIKAVEQPLLEQVMQRSGCNQLQAAKTLGINRNTLRTKLRDHGLLP